MAETCSTVAILLGNYFSEQYYRPEGNLHPGKLRMRVLQAAFGKIRTLVAPSPQPSAAAQHIHLTTIGILQYLSPSLQFLLGLTAFHEPFSRMQFAGHLWVWAGVALFVWGARNTKTT